ncbi:MAG: AAA family ATPase [Clostridiales bacterium]|nr:AAA family ATPase [Clostridiales bacterium]
MSKIMAIVNQKGGVGKTTTAINLSAYLAKFGRNVLIIDLDPQANSTSGLGVEKKNLNNTIYELLLGEKNIHSAKIATNVPNLDIIPADKDLSGATIELLSATKREYILKNIVSHLELVYDYIIIDCPPALNILTLNALVASNSIIVPMQCEYFALEGLSQLFDTVNLIKNSLNPKLYIEGIVFTMYDGRTKLSLEVVENVKQNISSDIFTTIVPRNIRLSEAPSHGLPILLYEPKSRGAEAYEILAKIVDTRRGKF